MAEFKKFVQSTSTVLGQVAMNLFPSCDAVNTAHRDCKVGSFFSGIMLLNSTKHCLHLDSNDKGPTVIYNECNEECLMYLVLEDFRFASKNEKEKENVAFI